MRAEFGCKRPYNIGMDEKELIKQKVDMVALVGETVQLKRAGSNWKGLCPFHGEKSPSFMVNPEMGIFKCFGCGEGGDCFAWVMKIEGLSFGEALQLLAEKTGVTLKQYKPSDKEQRSARLMELLAAAAEFYHYLLMKHPVGEPGREYIKGRGMKKETVEAFKLGWAPDDWEAVQRFLVQKKKFTHQELLDAGLIIGREGRSGFYDRFRGRVVFPLRNVRGQVVGFSGRIIIKDDKAPKYINSPETLLYHKGSMLFGLEVVKQDIRKAGRVILVEGEMDMLSSWQSGVKEIVAIKGSALTEEQIRLLQRYTSKLVLALDMDLAGDQAARRGLQMAEAAGMEVRVVQIEGGKDPDDMARQNPEGWKKAVDEAREVYEFLLDSAIRRHGLDSGYGKQKIVAELLPMWRGIANEVLLSHWIGKLAQRVGVDEGIIGQQIGNRQTRERNVELSPEVGEERKMRDVLEEQLTGWWLGYQPDKLLEESMKKRLRSVWVRRLLLYLEEKGTADGWLAELPEELRSKVAEVMMMPEVSQDLGAAPLDVVDGWFRRLVEIDTKDEIQDVQRKMQEAEDGGDELQLQEAQSRFSELTQQLRRLQQASSKTGG